MYMSAYRQELYGSNLLENSIPSDSEVTIKLLFWGHNWYNVTKRRKLLIGDAFNEARQGGNIT